MIISSYPSINPKETDNIGGVYMKYSILITYYQNQNILKTALTLLLKTLGNRMDVEIIISSDNPKVNIDAFRDIDKLSRIYTINATENGGYSVACNKAAQMAKGELLILMDSDIFVTDGWLNALEEVYKSKPNVGSVSSTILSLNTGSVVHWGLSTIGVEILKPFRDGKLPEKLFNTITESPLLTSGCLMVKKEIFETVGGMDTAFYNGYCDLDFSMKLRMLKLKNYVTTNSIVYHRGKVAGQIRIMGEEDTRALFFNRWNEKIPSEGVRMYLFLLSLSLHKTEKDYVLFNFSKSLYLEKYIECIQQTLGCESIYKYDLKNCSLPILLEDILPWELCADTNPYIYFCDNINSLTQNRHWFFHRKEKGDLIIDRNGNVSDTDSIFN